MSYLVGRIETQDNHIFQLAGLERDLTHIVRGRRSVSRFNGSVVTAFQANAYLLL